MLAPRHPLIVLALAAGLTTGLASDRSSMAQVPVAAGQEIALSRSQWKLFLPAGLTADAGGDVDLLVHFHGDPATVRNNAAHAELNAAIVTVNYPGLSNAYSTPFADASLFGTLLDDARTTLAGQPGFDFGADWDRLAVSSFSAGYGAVRRVLGQADYADRIDAVLAADSLYATTAADGTALDSQMAPYKAFADRAASGEKTFVFTHSQVETSTYESTAETGDELMRHLRIAPAATGETGLGSIRYYRKAESGGFRLWGARGADGEAHLEHLRYLGEWLDDLGLDTFGAATLPGDYNGDGRVDAADYTVWRDHWLSFREPGVGLPADGNGDGFVGNSDYAMWAEQYGETVDQSTAVPAPGAGVLLSIAVVTPAIPTILNLRGP